MSEELTQGSEVKLSGEGDSPLEALARRIVQDAARDRAELHDHWDLWAVPELRRLLIALRKRPELIAKVAALVEAETTHEAHSTSNVAN